MTDLKFSRAIAAAENIVDKIDAHRFVDKCVLLTAEKGALQSPNGITCLLYCLQLLPRICKNVTVALPASAPVHKQCVALAKRIQQRDEIKFHAGDVDYSDFDAILSVGKTVQPGLPWTVVSAQGWLARVSSTATMSGDNDLDNPISCLAAASLGVGEVFKRLINLNPEKGAMLDSLTFSLFDYSSGEASGPALPRNLTCDKLLLVGAGAIGNGLLQLFRDLPIKGKFRIVDNQKYGDENWGTCCCLGPTDIDKDKASFGAGFLNNPEARSFTVDVQKFIEKATAENWFPTFVVNALDNVEARHAVQDLWPDVVIDGAIGDFGCQVSVHPWGPDVACLKCQLPLETKSALKQQVAATGLTTQQLGDPDAILTVADVELAAPGKRLALQEHVGKKICAVTQAMVADAISLHKVGFAPSVPFVATMSAAMVCAELVKKLCRWETPLAPLFQFNLLVGPNHGRSVPAERKADCICTQRTKNIEKVRQARLNRPVASGPLQRGIPI